MDENEKRNGDGRVVLVIGGAGYVGSVLTRMLLETGYRVHCLDNFLYGNPAAIASFMDDPGFTLLPHDLRNERQMHNALKTADDVVLLAALVGDPVSKAYPDLTRSVNLDATKRIIELASEIIDGRFLFSSTCSNYGVHDGSTPATEESDLNPKSLYAETKVEIERILLSKKLATSNFSPTVLRFATAFGLSPRMRFDLTIADFTHQIFSKGGLQVFDENTWRPYCHLKDMSRAIHRCLECDRSKIAGEVFNVGSDSQNYTKRMIVDEIVKYFPNAVITKSEGDIDPRDYRVSFRKIASELEFQTRYSVPDFIGNLVRLLDLGAYSDVITNRPAYGNFKPVIEA